MPLRPVSLVPLALGFVLLSGSSAPGRAQPAESSVPVALSLRTSLPAGSVFVAYSDGSPERFLGGTAFVGRLPGDAVKLSFLAPSGDGEIRVWVNHSHGRPNYLFGRIKVSFPPGEARRLDVSETERRGLAFRFGAPEPVAAPTAARHAPAASSPAVTVPVSLVLTTAMPAGAVFVAWSGAPDIPALAGRAFVGHVPAEPIELRFQVPVGSGAFTVYLSCADARMGVASNSGPTTLAAGDTPRLVAVAPLRVPSQLQVSLDSGK